MRYFLTHTVWAYRRTSDMRSIKIYLSIYFPHEISRLPNSHNVRWESIFILWSICVERFPRRHSWRNFYCNFYKETEDILFLPGHRRRSSVNFRGGTFLPEKYVWKINNKMPEFYMILARKIITIPEFLLYLPEKLTKFTWFSPEEYPNFT